MTEAEVLSAMLSGNPPKENEALSFLLKEYRKSVTNYVCKWGGNMQEGEDVLIEGIAEVYYAVKAEKFRGESALGTYIFQVCKFIWMRKNRRKNAMNMNDEYAQEIHLIREWGSEYASPDFFLLQKDEQKVLAEIFGLIPKTCAQILHFFSQCMPFKDIAAAMGYQNAQVAMNKKSLCLGQLRSAIDSNPFVKKLIEELGWKHYSPK